MRDNSPTSPRSVAPLLFRQVRQMAELGVTKLWIQPGAGSDEIESVARESGIEVHHGCVLIEFGWH